MVTFTVDSVTGQFFDSRTPAFCARVRPGTIFGQTQPIAGVTGA